LVVSCAGWGFFSVLLEEELFEKIETVAPVALVVVQPLVRADEWSGLEMAEMGAAAHLAADQSGVL
jgi:hypothetical protein